jgi:hypothetical protein
MFGGSINRKIFSLAKSNGSKIGSILSRPKNLSTIARIGANGTSILGTGLSLAGMPEVGVPLLGASTGLMLASKSIDKGRQMNKDRRTIR